LNGWGVPSGTLPHDVILPNLEPQVNPRPELIGFKNSVKSEGNDVEWEVVDSRHLYQLKDQP